MIKNAGNFSKAVRVAKSCKTIDHMVTTLSWLENVYNNNYLTEFEYTRLLDVLGETRLAIMSEGLNHNFTSDSGEKISVKIN
jgi:hypothetical protein